MITAFNETKTAADWAQDTRCKVKANTLICRIRRGWAAERAIADEIQIKRIVLTGIYSITNKINNRKYYGSAVDFHARRLRHLSDLRKGKHANRYLQRAWNKYGEQQFEFLFELPVPTDKLLYFEQIYLDNNNGGYNISKRADRPSCEYPSRCKRILAFGEIKTTNEWLKDHRCKCDRKGTLLSRLAAGWAVEAAISLPIGMIWKNHSMQPISFCKQITAFGETKATNEWLKDCRCSVSRGSLLYRLRLGWDAEKAISAPVNTTPSKLLGLKRTKGEIRKSQVARSYKITAFGETKILTDWVEDPRCSVSKETLRKRLQIGWLSEDAIVTPPCGNYGNKVAAFGDVKNVAQWAKDKRCKVKLVTLSKRLESGWLPEVAISSPVRTKGQQKVGKNITAFGETKTITDWWNDRRCKVSKLNTLVCRLRAGWPPEQAITKEIA